MSTHQAVLADELDAFDEPYEDGDQDEYLDEIAIERLMQGDQDIPLYRSACKACGGRPGVALAAEAVETIRRLAGRGLNDAQISRRLKGRLSRGAVFQARKRNGIPNGTRQVAA